MGAISENDANAGRDPTPPARSKPTVLLVDDNLTILTMLTFGLQDEFTAVTATDGVKGLHAFEEAQPQCVVVDVKMPNLDGFQFIRALRGDPATAQTPLVILTALHQDMGELAGLASGADRYLMKPVVPSELIPAIYAAIAVSDEQRRARLRALASDED
ncbi:MAG TPA: response regulator [Ktedonobacterales bacterium]|nr:response regulator [Ktedonobacterales bacterium]